MTIEIELPDGTILEAPDDITPEGVKAATRNALGGAAPARAAAPQLGLGQKLGLMAQDTVYGDVAQAAGGTANYLADLAVRGANSLGLSQTPAEQLPSARYKRFLEQVGLPPKGGIVGAPGEALGMLTDPAGVAMAGMAPARATTQEAVRRGTARRGMEAGYSMPPSQVRGTPAGDLMQGLSGSGKVEQALVLKNQRATDALARRALRLPEDAPLTREAISSFIGTTSEQGYAPLDRLANINMRGLPYTRELENIALKYANPSKDFPGVAAPEIAAEVAAYKVPQFSGESARLILRNLHDKTDDAFRQGQGRLGSALKEVANVIEDNIARDLKRRGKSAADILGTYEDTRRTLAKAYQIRNAIKEGGGSVELHKLSGELQRGAPLTDELRTMAEFGNTYRDITKLPTRGEPSPLGIPDVAMGVGAAYASLGEPTVLAALGSRYGMRKLLESPAYQKSLLRNLQRQPSETTHPFARGLFSGSTQIPGAYEGASSLWSQPESDIDLARPMLSNADGSFSTERTITIEADGKHLLIPTIVGGKQLSPEAAIAAWEAGTNKPVGIFNSSEEADAAAVARSKRIGALRSPPSLWSQPE